MRQTACLVINPTSADSYASRFNCTMVGRLKLNDGLDIKLSQVDWALMLCLWPGPPWFSLWFPLTLACSGGLAKSALSLFRLSDRFDFVFSPRCIDINYHVQFFLHITSRCFCILSRYGDFICLWHYAHFDEYHRLTAKDMIKLPPLITDQRSDLCILVNATMPRRAAKEGDQTQINRKAFNSICSPKNMQTLFVAVSISEGVSILVDLGGLDEVCTY